MWLYEGKEFTPEQIESNTAFVYRITNLETGKQYLGKKNFTKIRSKKIKDKVRKKRIKTESDWREYFGSNSVLLEDVERLGQDRFRREILKLCKTKGTANYWEAWYQMKERALESENYYNDWIFVKVHRSHIKE
jgi:hypothetical protein